MLQEATVITDVNGIPNTVSIDRVTPASSPVLPSHVSNKSSVTPYRQLKDKQNSTNNKCGVKRIVNYIGESRDTKYVVRQYSYSAKNDTVEHVDRSPKHFRAHYWRRVNKSN